jgi:thioredoxin 1
MLNRRSIFGLFAALSVFAALPALAAEQPFTQAAFDDALKSGKPVLVEVHAPWCPTCRAQGPILNELTMQPRFKDMAVFKVDFDSQKDALKAFRANMQSTLIVFKQSKEAGRSVGDTNRASIEALLARAL